MSGGRMMPRILQRPEQGWSSLLLLLGMLMVLGLSVADSRPLLLDPEGAPVTDAMLPLMVSAGLIGYLLARSSMGIVRAHVLGAAIAALMLLLVGGAALLEDGSPLPTGLDGIGERVSAVWVRLDADMARYLGSAVSTPTMATYLVLGAICWTTAQFSAFSVFRHDRGGPAVMATGAVLFLNVGLGSLAPAAELLPVVPVLALFSALAMLLLMRLQLGQQRKQWARRHISDTGEVSRLFLRSGVLFVLFAVVSAGSLTVWATVDPRDVDLGGLQEPFEEIAEELSWALGLFAVQPPDTARVRPDDRWSVDDLWEQSSEVAFRARIDGQIRGNYWWGWAHDRFDGRSWDRDKVGSVSLAANELIPVPQAATAGGAHVAAAEITVEGQGVVQGMVFRLAEADAVDRAVVAYRVDDGDGIGDIEFEDPLEPGDVVRVESRVRDYSRDATSLTANQLRATANTPYPAWVLDRYLQGTEPAIAGERVGRVASGIARDARSNPYDQAIAVQALLQQMDYTTDMRGVCDDGEVIPDCVLRTERGFCQHYATTMTMLLRELGIPSRIVTGYLRGTREREEWVVEQAAFHNWVEAYFPGVGWIRFDPTPRGDEFGRLATDLPPGPESTPEPPQEPDRGRTGPEDTFEPLESPPLEEVIVGDDGSDDADLGAALLLGGVLVVMLGLVVAGLLLFRLRRLSEADGSLAYRGIVSLATRLGHGPHPAQTEYEYASNLSTTLPGVREELYLVVDTRVESAYGRRQLDPRRRGALKRAYARVRTALLRFWLRLQR